MSKHSEVWKEATKRCSKCKIFKPFSEFYKEPKYVLSPSCKTCNKLDDHHITLEKYEKMLSSQNNKCAICRGSVPGGPTNQWLIDHDHKCCSLKRGSCGKCIRGLLCSNCNRALGLFQDSPEILSNAIMYLCKIKVRRES